jgi:hypothetical protein
MLMNHSNIQSTSISPIDLLPLNVATVASVAFAVRRFATAVSSHLGSDCFLHMELGRHLLAKVGIDANRVVGFAAWRVGCGDGDVISHAPHSPGYAPPGQAAFAYHAWLEFRGVVIDFTTYQLQVKARQLDQADGGQTTVEWCPDFLMLVSEQVQTYRHVAMASFPGVAYYEARPELLAALEPAFVLDPGDLATARLLLAHPELSVFGPNDAQTDGALHRPMRMAPQRTMRTHVPELERFLKARDIRYVRVEYRGSEGGGGFDAIEFSRADGAACLIGDGAFHLRLKAVFRAVLMSRYPAWSLGDGSCGDFRWDLSADLLTHSHYLRGSTTERTTHHNLSS